jgi:hypothetical protein
MLWALAPYSLDRKTGKVGIPRPGWRRRVKGWQSRINSIPGWGHNSFTNVKRFIPLDYFKFAFVRNPFQLIYSSWARNLETKNTNHTKTFKEYVEGIKEGTIAKVHTHWTQWEYLSYKGELELDFIGRFENILDDWKHVLEVVGLEGVDLPRLNQNEEKDTSRYREAYTPAMRRFVEKKYAKDLEVFGYEF